jgi:hypothetical protein
MHLGTALARERAVNAHLLGGAGFRSANMAPFNPGFSSLWAGTLVLRMYCAAFSTLRASAGFSIDIKSREEPGAITSRWTSGCASAFQTSCGMPGGMATAVFFSATNLSVPIWTFILPSRTRYR